MRLLLSILVLYLYSHHVVAGGGWVNPKHSWYIKFGQQWVNFNEYYNSEGNLVGDRTRSIGSTFVYAEYGLAKRWNVILYLPFFTKATIFEQKNSANGQVLNEGESHSSVGDANLTIKYGLLQKNSLVLSTSLTFGLPFGDTMQGTDGSLQTGDGEFNQMLSVDIGGSVKVGKFSPYWSAYSGYNNRTEGFSDEWRYGLEVGGKVGKWWMILKSNAVRSLNNGTAGNDLFYSGILVNNAEYFILTPEIAYEFSKDWGLSFNYAKALSGKLMYAQPSYTIAMFFNLNNKVENP